MAWLPGARFSQICCRDIRLFFPLPWFSAMGASSLQNMGSNARAGFLDLVQDVGRRRFRGTLRGLSLNQLWKHLAPWMVSQAEPLLDAAAGACPQLDTMSLSHSLCEKCRPTEALGCLVYGAITAFGWCSFSILGRPV